MHPLEIVILLLYEFVQLLYRREKETGLFIFGKFTKRKFRAADVKLYETKLLYRIERQFRRMRFSKQRDTVRRVISGVNFVVTEVELQVRIW